MLYSAGLVVLRDHTNRVCGVAATVYQGNKARGGSAGSLIVKTVGSIRERLVRKAHRRPTCAWGRPEAIHGVTRSGAWPLRGIPYEGLQRELGGSLRASRYLSKNTGVVDGSLHLYRPLPSAFIFSTLVVCFTISSLVDRLVDRIGT